MTVTTVPPALDARFREAAASTGLLDVGYDVVESAIGPLFLAATDRGLCRVAFQPEPDEYLDRLARAFGPRVLRSGSSVDNARRHATRTVTVTVRAEASTGLPLLGALVDGFEVTGRATMRIER